MLGVITRQVAAVEQAPLAAWPAGRGTWPVRSGTVPPLAACFCPRPETGSKLARTLARGVTVVLTPPAASTRAARQSPAALGGTGKTQLAAAMARSLWRSGEVDLLAWVPAASRDAVITGYAEALAAAGIPGGGSGLKAAAARFLAWLATTSRPWLVVLDDLTDPGDLDELWPHGPAGIVVVTTRLPATALRADGRKIIEVGPFSPREALTYLTARLHTDPGMRAGALDLANDLGRLPLCLTQASSVVAGNRIDCLRYRAAFTDRAARMPVAGAGRPAATLAATWSLAFDRAAAMSPPGTAAAGLVLAALLDPAGIPGAILTSPAACEFICGSHATNTPADESTVRNVFDNLAEAGLVTIDPDSPVRTVRMHALVQAAVRRVVPH
jgi:hypothetical protein